MARQKITDILTANTGNGTFADDKKNRVADALALFDALHALYSHPNGELFSVEFTSHILAQFIDGSSGQAVLREDFLTTRHEPETSVKALAQCIINGLQQGRNQFEESLQKGKQWNNPLLDAMHLVLLPTIYLNCMYNVMMETGSMGQHTKEHEKCGEPTLWQTGKKVSTPLFRLITDIQQALALNGYTAASLSDMLTALKNRQNDLSINATVTAFEAARQLYTGRDGKVWGKIYTASLLVQALEGTSFRTAFLNRNTTKLTPTQPLTDAIATLFTGFSTYPNSQEFRQHGLKDQELLKTLHLLTLVTIYNAMHDSIITGGQGSFQMPHDFCGQPTMWIDNQQAVSFYQFGFLLIDIVSALGHNGVYPAMIPDLTAPQRITQGIAGLKTIGAQNRDAAKATASASPHSTKKSSSQSRGATHAVAAPSASSSSLAPQKQRTVSQSDLALIELARNIFKDGYGQCMTVENIQKLLLHVLDKNGNVRNAFYSKATDGAALKTQAMDIHNLLNAQKLKTLSSESLELLQCITVPLMYQRAHSDVLYKETAIPAIDTSRSIDKSLTVLEEAYRTYKRYYAEIEDRLELPEYLAITISHFKPHFDLLRNNMLAHVIINRTLEALAAPSSVANYSAPGQLPIAHHPKAASHPYGNHQGAAQPSYGQHAAHFAPAPAYVPSIPVQNNGYAQQYQPQGGYAAQPPVANSYSAPQTHYAAAPQGYGQNGGYAQYHQPQAQNAYTQQYQAQQGGGYAQQHQPQQGGYTGNSQTHKGYQGRYR